MLKTLFATTALASMLALGAQAQTAPADPDTDPAAAPIIENEMAPAEAPADATTPIVPQAQNDADPAMAPDVLADPLTGPTLEDGWSTVDVATISADTLIGTEIRNYNQETIASVQDLLLSADGQAESVVARFGGFLGFGENTVLLTMDEISVVKDANDNTFVLTNLTPEALTDRPDYVPPEG